MKYIASIGDNFPFKLYGQFESKNDYDYLVFLTGNRIETIPSFRISYKTNEITKLLKWDILAVNRSVYLISGRFQELLLKLCEDSVQFIKGEFVTDDNTVIDKYMLLNIVNTDKSDTADICRDEATRIIYSERLVLEMKRKKLKGLTFYPVD